MKTKLLKKIRKRTLSIDYSQEDSVVVEYLNSRYKRTIENLYVNANGFISHWDFIDLLECMFDRDSFLIWILKFKHRRAIKNRTLAQVKNKKMEYKFKC